MPVTMMRLFASDLKIEADGGTYVFTDMQDVHAYSEDISFFTDYKYNADVPENIRKGIGSLLGRKKGKCHAVFALFSTPDGKVKPVCALHLIECLEHANTAYREGTYYWSPVAHPMFKGTNILLGASKVIRYLAWLKLGQPAIYMYGFLLDNGHFTVCDAEGETAIMEQYYEKIIADISIVKVVELSTGEKITFFLPDFEKALSAYHDVKSVSDDLYNGAMALRGALS